MEYKLNLEETKWEILSREDSDYWTHYYNKDLDFYINVCEDKDVFQSMIYLDSATRLQSFGHCKDMEKIYNNFRVLKEVWEQLYE